MEYEKVSHNSHIVTKGDIGYIQVTVTVTTCDKIDI